jgi:hypothetical protein
VQWGLVFLGCLVQNAQNCGALIVPGFFAQLGDTLDGALGGLDYANWMMCIEDLEEMMAVAWRVKLCLKAG